MVETLPEKISEEDAQIRESAKRLLDISDLFRVSLSAAEMEKFIKDNQEVTDIKAKN